ncbi:hypothetical protein GGR56DRAFT_424839 [Xylariaceae sp. FL0804]|nr:hypothetical protein GGR56DRAFT_424839 [Xylariaceae sp. FL0804]
MDDAGLNENVGQHSQAVDGPEREDEGQDHVHMNPSRWWFASAAFPMIAGTWGPVASAFSICALAKNWRQYIPPDSNVTIAIFVGDPPWLYAINAIQLFIAVVANAFLLLNMTKRVRFSVAQPITIVGWYVSAICLVSLCATAGGPLLLQPEIDYVWSQAFYYAIFSAILYFIVASLMVVTVWGAEAGHYPQDFELSTSQRTLMLQTIVFLGYLLLGALVFSHIEGWNYLDGVYWADVTLFTVGFGDFYPQTNLGRGLLIPFALVGITSFGLVIGSIRSFMLDKGKSKLDARMLEKKRRQFIRSMTRKGKAHLLDPIENVDYYPETKDSGQPLTEFERRQKEFYLMRKIQDQTSRRRRWTAMGISTCTFVVLWLVGAKIFQECERPYQGWTYWQGVYFAFTGLTTIGYGTPSPVSNGSKAFFVFWSLLALPTQTVLISNAGDTVVKAIRDGTLRLGDITILPGEAGVVTETKQLLSWLSCGRLFVQDDEDTKDGSNDIEGNRSSQTRSSKGGRGSSSSTSKTNDTTERGRGHVESAASNGREKTDMPRPSGRASSKPRENLPENLPKTSSEYHLVLIDEIRRVTQHLQNKPPRKYTFKEWAWYLRLMGENEDNPDMHRMPAQKPHDADAPKSDAGPASDGEFTPVTLLHFWGSVCSRHAPCPPIF